jgi:hypothetical protein
MQPRLTRPPKRLLIPLLLLSLTLSLSLCGLACEKNVQEVRHRPDLPSSAVANGSKISASQRDVPVAPSAEPVGISGNPKTPG